MYLLKSFLSASFILSGWSAIAQVNGHPDTIKVKPKESAAVEIEAVYPGGQQAWSKFLHENLNSNIPSKNKAPIGRYTAAALFTVDTDGSLSNVKPVTNFGFGMEEEVIRVIEKSGKWEPATRNGKLLKANRKQLITFILASADFVITTEEPFTLFANAANEISVTAAKIKAADISINVQGGRPTRIADGRFSIRVNKPGRVTIEVVNNKKDDKEIGQASFEVKAK